MLAHCALLITSFFYVAGNYTPTWDSLDERPLPKWYDEAKIGIFLYWGVFSVPSYGTIRFWHDMHSNTSTVAKYMKRNHKPGFQYPAFASQFTAEFYNPDQWADILAASGAKYVLFTGKHREGYAMWPSDASWNWNARDIGPGRDLLGELATAIRKKTDLYFGVYYSFHEWYNPYYLKDYENKFKTRNFVEKKVMPELIDFVTEYKPEMIWAFDGGVAPDTYWKSRDFLAWLYNESPVKDVVVVNDQWGAGTECHHGGFLTCNNVLNPKTLQLRKWENYITIDRYQWAFQRNSPSSNYRSVEELIATLAETMSSGGNLLIYVGPSHDGLITPPFEKVLRQLGTWLKINGEAIYKSQPWTYQKDTITPNVWYTTRGNYVYAIVLNWPKNSTLILGALDPPEKSKIFMLGVNEALTWDGSMKQTVINFPSLTPEAIAKWAWVVKIPKIPL